MSNAASYRVEINRANAQHSTGPVSIEGKAISSRNALKHGLTGNTVLLDSDDAAEYQQRLDYYTGQYNPVTFEERRLVQAIHDANWRLDRITNLEFAIFAKGRMELDGSFADLPADQRKSFVQLEISQRYAKNLRNLHTQESRLQRQRAKDLLELKQLQTERWEAETDADAKAAKPAPSHSNGFVFSNDSTQPNPGTTPSQPATDSTAGRH